MMTTEQVKANVEITTKTDLALIGGGLYKRDGKQWRLLESKPRVSNSRTEDRA